MTKQEAVKQAYGSQYDFLKPDENGWFKDDVLGNSEELSVWVLSECERKWNDDNELVWRLTSIAGIEDNNGWIKIESEDDLPTYDEYCWIEPQKDRFIIAWYNYTDTYFYDNQGNKWLWRGITHYQPINKPEKPLY